MGGRGGRRAAAPDEILAGHPPAVVAVANAARALVVGMIDGVVEEGDRAAGRIVFRRRGAFAFVAPMADHVLLGFLHGHALPDLPGLLEETGGPVRQVTLRSVEQLGSRGVRMLVSVALFDDDTHGFRRRVRGP